MSNKITITFEVIDNTITEDDLFEAMCAAVHEGDYDALEQMGIVDVQIGDGSIETVGPDDVDEETAAAVEASIVRAFGKKDN